jgi:acyl-CoA carboxylase subunit alpha
VTGQRAITSVLVANRGEIARRVFRTCRRLGIRTVAVVSDADRGAPFASEADSAVHIGGRTPAESYLRADAVLDAAMRAGADAIHPGYGFLSENAIFARSVSQAGLVWIGPSAEAIAAMGSKTEARTRMQDAGVPIVPGAHLHAGDDPLDAASAVGFPLLVKASAGGGGRGMRLVRTPGALLDSIDSAQREAAAAFGDSTVFLERFVPRSRHVEVQLIGDHFGTIVALHERDCSIQRRHQKVIEEAPSPAVDPALRERLNAMAATAGRALAYSGVGTVEFLLAEGAEEFFFLEVNTRLQVEHPVTEAITDLDLVELQITVAEGRPLPTEIQSRPIRGWAMEARLYAEDPRRGFVPVSGRLTRLRVPDHVRVDAGVEDGSEVSPFYDPMVAKIVAHGATRDEAARILSDALMRAEIQGMVTNRDFLVRVLRHPEFRAGRADTTFLDQHADGELTDPLVGPARRRLAALAAAIALQARHRRDARVLATLPSGWRNNPALPQRVVLDDGDVETTVLYRFARDGSTLAQASVNGHVISEVQLAACSENEVRLIADGLESRYGVASDAEMVHVSTAEGEVSWRRRPRFADASTAAEAGSLMSPMPGIVTRLDATVGMTTKAGQPLLVLEAMKMEHEIVASADGTLTELRVAEGDHVQAGQVLAVIESTLAVRPVASPTLDG